MIKDVCRILVVSTELVVQFVTATLSAIVVTFVSIVSALSVAETTLLAQLAKLASTTNVPVSFFTRTVRN